jgi:hypothetical protein
MHAATPTDGYVPDWRSGWSRRQSHSYNLVCCIVTRKKAIDWILWHLDLAFQMFQNGSGYRNRAAHWQCPDEVDHPDPLSIHSSFISLSLFVFLLGSILIAHIFCGWN